MEKMNAGQKIFQQTSDETNIDSRAILPADHPLLEKFQKALKEHLLKINNRLSDEIDEIDHNIGRLKKEQENVGERLYDYQQEAEQQKEMLDEYNERLNEVSEKRLKNEINASKLKRDYVGLTNKFQEASRNHEDKLLELTQTRLLENNISKWAQEMEDEVKAAKRVVSKDKQSQLAVSQQKRQMDLLLLNLEGEVKRRDQELAAINEQIKDQNGKLEFLNRNLSDGNADLNGLQSELKRLIGAWREVISQIQLKDEVLAKLRRELNDEMQNHKLIQSNIEGTKRATAKEMEQNEKLESFKLRLENDFDLLEQKLEKELNDQTKLMSDVSKMSALVEQTETDLSRANIEGQLIENNLRTLRKRLEKQSTQKIEIEEKILELLQDQITTDSASNIRSKLLKEIQGQRRNAELNMYTTEYQLSQVLLELEKWKGQLSKSRENADRLKGDYDAAMEKSASLDEEIKAMEKSINAKVKSYDMMGRQLEKLIEAAGGLELDPNELKVKSLEKKLADLEIETREAQNFWLRLQKHVVNLSEKRSLQQAKISLTSKQLLVIEQKNMRIDSQYEALKKKDRAIEQEVKNLTTRVDQLSTSLFQKKTYHEVEEANCQNSHAALLDKLKEREISFLALQQELSDREKEIERTEQLMLEKHHEALSWETKWKLAEEARKYQHAELAATGEIGLIKSEIHRMEVRYNQLKRAQEKLSQDMESCVGHRDHVYEKACAREKLPDHKGCSKKSGYYRATELKNKLKQVRNETISVERNIADVTIQKDEMLSELKKLKDTIDNERLQDSLLQSEIEQTILMKQENLENIVRMQQRAKRYKGLINAKQMPKIRNEAVLQSDLERQLEIRNHLLSLLESLLNDFPDHKYNIKRVLQTLKNN
ncbi:coiled-coil domain-containing protein 40 [Bradysia coprophila]|uniref:coiled-coil domain-containing protein 40 n=1 Tax=Bradysia coprophila TaxID=38358 RepID=UPI00187D9E38|nr:coiled-coil domain-containing protein 40 [Bradysia coprophila]